MIVIFCVVVIPAVAVVGVLASVIVKAVIEQVPERAEEEQ